MIINKNGFLAGDNEDAGIDVIMAKKMRSAANLLKNPATKFVGDPLTVTLTPSIDPPSIVPPSEPIWNSPYFWAGAAVFVYLMFGKK